MQGAKSANSRLFKDFCNAAEMEKNCSNRKSYFDILTYNVFNSKFMQTGAGGKERVLAGRSYSGNKK
jgi:hypothetical protein